jgi:Predicted membrane protein (DUF2157)
MATPLVIRRIEAWEAAGLIDPETADRLREAEANAVPVPDQAAEARAAGAGRGLGVTAVELFVYLGAAFVLGAWYALIASTNPSWEDSSARFAAAGLIAALALALLGVAMAGRDARFRRAAGVAFLVALPNLGAGVYLLADTLHHEVYPDAPTNTLVASIVVLLAALVARRVLPALTTQLGLAAAAATVGGLAMGWLDAVLFPRGGVEWQPRPIDETAALVRVLLSMVWWWAVAAAMAVLLVILDPEPRTEGRTRLGRIAVGLTAVLGTTSAVFVRHDWIDGSSLSGQPVLEPFVGAAIILAVSGVLLVLAVRRQSVGYLWPGGLGVFIALTWMNAEYLAVESGLWIALLVEGAVLFGVAFGVNRMSRRLQPGEMGTPVG